MSANKKQFNKYYSGTVRYNKDGPRALGKPPRKYKQPLITIPTSIVILISAIGIVYLMFQSGIIK
jgi:hypothetical protein